YLTRCAVSRLRTARQPSRPSAPSITGSSWSSVSRPPRHHRVGPRRLGLGAAQVGVAQVDRPPGVRRGLTGVADRGSQGSSRRTPSRTSLLRCLRRRTNELLVDARALAQQRNTVTAVPYVHTFRQTFLLRTPRFSLGPTKAIRVGPAFV